MNGFFFKRVATGRERIWISGVYRKRLQVQHREQSGHNGKRVSWNSTIHPKKGMIDSQDDLRAVGAGSD